MQEVIKLSRRGEAKGVEIVEEWETVVVKLVAHEKQT